MLLYCANKKHCSDLVITAIEWRCWWCLCVHSDTVAWYGLFVCSETCWDVFVSVVWTWSGRAVSVYESLKSSPLVSVYRKSLQSRKKSLSWKTQLSLCAGEAMETTTLLFALLLLLWNGSLLSSSCLVVFVGEWIQSVSIAHVPLFAVQFVRRSVWMMMVVEMKKTCCCCCYYDNPCYYWYDDNPFHCCCCCKTIPRSMSSSAVLAALVLPGLESLAETSNSELQLCMSLHLACDSWWPWRVWKHQPRLCLDEPAKKQEETPPARRRLKADWARKKVCRRLQKLTRETRETDCFDIHHP